MNMVIKCVWPILLPTREIHLENDIESLCGFCDTLRLEHFATAPEMFSREGRVAVWATLWSTRCVGEFTTLFSCFHNLTVGN